jgi:hypothetical protein
MCDHVKTAACEHRPPATFKDRLVLSGRQAGHEFPAANGPRQLPAVLCRQLRPRDRHGRRIRSIEAQEAISRWCHRKNERLPWCRPPTRNIMEDAGQRFWTVLLGLVRGAICGSRAWLTPCPDASLKRRPRRSLISSSRAARRGRARAPRGSPTSVQRRPRVHERQRKLMPALARGPEVRRYSDHLLRGRFSNVPQCRI